MSELPGTLPFHYDPLPPGKYFRYLVLRPGKHDEPLECSLHSCLLDEAPPFEAISYAWGSPAKPCALTCNGRLIPITASLRSSLRQVRQATEARAVWADSVCINQEDLEEQGRQVYFMDEIYFQSKQTLICLGMDDNGNALLAGGLVFTVAELIDSEMEELRGAAQGQITDANMEVAWNNFSWPDPQHPLLYDSRWAAYDEMVKHLWFKRGWVVQEAAMAHDSMILWSYTQIPWRDVMRVCIWLNRRSPASFNHRLTSIPWLQLIAHRHKCPEDFRAFYPSVHRDNILTILHHARLLGFMKARDRIFAFKALARFTSMEDIFSDLEYSQTHTALYHDFTCKYIEKTADTGFLDYIMHTDETLRDVENHVVPSWVLRWDVRMELTFAIWGKPMRVSSLSVLEPAFDDTKRVLRVRGARIDRVMHAFDVAQDPTLVMLLHLEEQVRNRTASTKLYERSSIMPLILDALCVGRFLGNWSDWCTRREALMCRFDDVRRHMADPSPHTSLTRTVTATDEDTDRLSQEVIFSAIRRGIWGRKFIVTAKGYCGVAPAVTQPGDWCSVISGTTALAVLRERDNTENGVAEFETLGSVWLASKNTRESNSQIFHYMLGSEHGAEWEDGAEEQEILLV